MNELSINILVDARDQYMKELSSILQPRLYEGISKMYDQGEDEYDFQQLLRAVPKWNQNVIEDEVARIMERSKCDWLHDLVCAVFISNAKILTAVRTVNTNQKINLKIPNLNNFVHNCYVECAREFYKNPFLMDRNSEDIKVIDKQRNMRESLSIIDTCIATSVRKLLPFQQIIKKYLTDSYEDEISDFEDDVEGGGGSRYGKKMVNAFKKNLYDSEGEEELDEDASEAELEDEYTDFEDEVELEDASGAELEDDEADEEANEDDLVVEEVSNGEAEEADEADEQKQEGDEDKTEELSEIDELDIENQMNKVLSGGDSEDAGVVKIEDKLESKDQVKNITISVEKKPAEVVNDEVEVTPETVVEEDKVSEEDKTEVVAEDEQGDSGAESGADSEAGSVTGEFDRIKYVEDIDEDGKVSYKEIVIDKKGEDEETTKTDLSEFEKKARVVDENVTGGEDGGNSGDTKVIKLDDSESRGDSGKSSEPVLKKASQDVGNVLPPLLDMKIIDKSSLKQVTGRSERRAEPMVIESVDIKEPEVVEEKSEIVEEEPEVVEERFEPEIQVKQPRPSRERRDPTRHKVRKRVIKVRRKKDPGFSFF